MANEFDPANVQWGTVEPPTDTATIPQGAMQSPGLLDVSKLNLMPVGGVSETYKNMPKWEDTPVEQQQAWAKKSNFDKNLTAFAIRGGIAMDKAITGALQMVYDTEKLVGVLSPEEHKTIIGSLPLFTPQAEQEILSKFPPEVAESGWGTTGEIAGAAAPFVVAGQAIGPLVRGGMGLAGATTPGAGAGGALARFGGPVVSGAVGGATVYTDPTQPSQRPSNMLVGAALGPAFPVAQNLLGSAATLLHSGTALPQVRRAKAKWDEILNQSGYTPFKSGTDESLRLDAQGQAKLTAAQISSHPVAQEMERQASILYPQLSRIKRDQQIMNYSADIQGTMKELADASSRDYAGTKVGQKIKDAVTNLKVLRNKDFTDSVDAAEKLVRGQPFIPNKAVKDWLAGEREVAAQILDPSKSAIALRSLGQIEDTLNKSIVGDKLTVTEFKDVMAFINGRIDKSGGYERSVLNRAKTALMDSVNVDRANFTGKQLDALELLQSARTSYGKSSNAINQVALGPIRAYLRNRTPEAGEKVLGTIQAMPASDVRNLVGTLQDFDPSTVNLLQRQVLESAWNKAREVGKTAGGDVGAYRFNLDTFAKSIPQGEKFDAFFGGSFAKKEIIDHLAMSDRLRNFADISSAPMEQAKKQAAQIGANVVQGKFKEQGMWISGLLSKYMDGPTYMKFMWDAEGRRALQTLDRFVLAPTDALAQQLPAVAAYLILNSKAAKMEEAKQVSKDNTVQIPRNAVEMR